ncbi:MAG: aminotransferase class IV [Bacteroidales bacterium]|jgi:branched-chain amino acid aminotransferase|nr:aminotransferase class IV [Bacteroidales bacterium]
MKKQFYIFEGELLPLAENPASDFSTHSHESVSETVRLYNTKPLFLKEHLQHLQQSLERVFLPMPALATFERVSRYITRLLNVNKVYKGGIATIHAITQAENITQLVITITALPELSYTFNNTGLHILHNSDFVLPQPFMHSSYNCNSAVWNMATRYAHAHNYNAACLCNYSNCIETTSAGQLVYMKNNCLTLVGNVPVNPLLEQFLQLLPQHNYFIARNTQCTITDFEGANDVFIFNTIDGIRWVSRLNNAVYGFKHAKDLYMLLVRFVEDYSITNN